MAIVNFTDKDKEDAFRLRQELRRLRATATENFFLVGERLKEIHDRELWRMGHESFDAYMADPEITIKRSTGRHAIKLIETFPDWKGLVEVPVSKLIMIAPHVTDENREEMLSEAEALSRSDLGYKLKSEGKIQARDEGLPKIYKCNTCKGLKGVRWEELCHCGWSPAQIDHLGKLIDAVDMGGKLDGGDSYEEEEEDSY